VRGVKCSCVWLLLLLLLCCCVVVLLCCCCCCCVVRTRKLSDPTNILSAGPARGGITQCCHQHRTHATVAQLAQHFCWIPLAAVDTDWSDQTTEQHVRCAHAPFHQSSRYPLNTLLLARTEAKRVSESRSSRTVNLIRLCMCICALCF